MNVATAKARPAQFSLKLLLVAFAGVCGVLGVGMLFGFGHGSALAVGLGAALTLKGWRERPSALTAIGSLIVMASGAGVLWALIPWLAFGVGPIYSSQNYPSSLKRMIEIADARSSRAKVYCHGTLLYIDYVCRIDVSPSQVERIIAEYELAEVEENRINTLNWEQFPRRWRPRGNYQSRVFEGMVEGTHVTALYDVDGEKMYAWCLEDVN